MTMSWTYNVEVARRTDPLDASSPYVFRACALGAAAGMGQVTVADRILGQTTERLSLTNSPSSAW